MSSYCRIATDLEMVKPTREGTLIGVGSFSGNKERLGRWGSLVLLMAAAVAAGCNSSITAAELPIEEKIAVRAGSATDTLAVAVLGGQNLLLLAGVDGSPAAEVRPGAQVTVPVTLDMSKVSPTGDLGSIQFELHYDPAVLEFVSGSDELSGTALINRVEPGRVRFAFASTDPQAKSALTLAKLNFQVVETAPAGALSAFSVTLAGAPTASDFGKYSTPVTFGGSVRIIPG